MIYSFVIFNLFCCFVDSGNSSRKQQKDKMKRLFYQYQHANAMIMYTRIGHRKIKRHHKGRFHTGDFYTGKSRFDPSSASTFLRSMDGALPFVFWEAESMFFSYDRVYYRCLISRHNNSIDEIARIDINEHHTMILWNYEQKRKKCKRC